MSRYQGRHRTQTPPIWRNSRLTVPVAAAAGLTLTAAGVAQATTSGTTAAAETSLSKPKTASAPVVNRVDVTAASRSQARATTQVASQVKRAAAARAASQKAAAAKLAADKQAAQKKAALAALSSSPAAKQLTVSAPAESTAAASGSSNKALASGGSSVSTTSASGFVCPIAGCGGRFTSGFGARSSPGGIGSTNHKGDDFATPVGTPLRAVHSGTVVAVGWYGGFGMRVEIDLGGGTSVIYGHMSAFSATVGERVSPGEVIGYSGNTGNSTGPHLHFEVHVNGVAVDPRPWMRARGIF